MHNIDRTQLEMQWEADPFGDAEYEYDDEHQEYDSYELEAFPGMYGETYDGAYEVYSGAGIDSPLSEADEMELAADLLEVMDEAELDEVLDELFRRVARGIRRAVPAAVRRRVVSGVKNVARRALPAAGAALGNVIAPGIGGVVGGRLAAATGRAFGLELEGLSPDDQEFEIARRITRLAGEAARQAAQAPAGASPQVVARRALTAAAQKHAPGLVGRAGAASAGSQPASGTWQRRGNTIVLYGVFR
jgi:hypothetical protein